MPTLEAAYLELSALDNPTLDDLIRIASGLSVDAGGDTTVLWSGPLTGGIERGSAGYISAEAMAQLMYRELGADTANVINFSDRGQFFSSVQFQSALASALGTTPDGAADGTV
jgi:hypothetical protein